MQEAGSRAATAFLQNRSPFGDYLLGLLDEQLGVRFDTVPQPNAEPVDLYHGNDHTVACKVRVPDVGRYTEATVPLIPTHADHARASDPSAPFPFDVFAAIRFWMADEANADAPPDAINDHDQLVAAASVQHRLGVLDVPIVNAYLQLFREYLRARCGVGVLRWIPNGKRCVVVLSHDADTPIDPADPRHAAWRAGNCLRAGDIAQAGRHAMSAALRAARLLRFRRERAWLFDELTGLEAGLGFRSTFFFCARSRSDPYGSPYDESYDIAAPRFRRLFDSLHRGGFEVGLHASYNARDDIRLLAEECESIERISGLRVLGNRHHYWHMKRPFWSTLDDHAAAGLVYDSSVAFDESPGYRLGFAFPCKLWNPLRQGRIEAIQVPTMVMDGAYFYHQGQTVDAVLEDFEKLLGNLKRFGGVAAINWHPRACLPLQGPFLEWGQAFTSILEMLAADREVAVQSTAELLGIEQTA